MSGRRCLRGVITSGWPTIRPTHCHLLSSSSSLERLKMRHGRAAAGCRCTIKLTNLLHLHDKTNDTSNNCIWLTGITGETQDHFPGSGIRAVMAVGGRVYSWPVESSDRTKQTTQVTIASG